MTASGAFQSAMRLGRIVIALIGRDLFGNPLRTFPDHALALRLGMIIPENRCALFRIMPWLRDD
jgi:hypothetical protein